MTDITIEITLSEQQARMYLQWLHCQYTLAMSEVWFSDRYRHVPDGERGRQVLADLPHLRGVCRTHKALQSKLAPTSMERPQ
ncbi:hypothetical protein P0Y43_16650 [Pseudomonas entomophila]|uniref:hypothetical protein n=1 Tax=Pseudomonas entomophila TaxID=312306 RepID=UPI0023D897A7|nr:hypothetical protein [Pseudomonas entomophila]MDF0732342.1 hypothetical protein [Pseudomonas entomophila]